ncbi:cyclin binding protein [Moniliophthora roreri MCA 2997]|uniref:Cyclin binding protein n=1 Tax=Moniliophthora roreri (strain MCA 2997) TaxID=1381753 RepID=V2XQY8_MONRO|nr:cyclin binding protein [Moniliophthora roreri MCA 2997]
MTQLGLHSEPSFYNSNRRPYHRRSTSNPVSIDPDLEDVPEVTTTPHTSPHSSPNPNYTTLLEPPPYSHDSQYAPNNSETRSEQAEGARLAPVRPHSVSRDDTHSQHGNSRASGSPSGQAEEYRGREKKKKRFSFSAIFNAIRGKRDGWREFKRGTYTYPISFVVPGHAPPTLDCPNGNVAWKIKGTVVRAGTFSSNIITTHPVLVIATPSPSLSSPSADEELVVVERSWEDQLHYLLSISGRSFHIGGRIPISFCLVPLREVKIHRVSVVLEEKIEYWTNFKRVARADPIVPYQLITVRQAPQEAGSDTPDHILPLHSSSLQVLQDSPLASVLDKREINEDNAVAFAGAGPWKWDVEIDLPGTCRSLHSSCKNRRSNMRVEHLLKCVLRVERGGDRPNVKKKRKLFDIVIQTPVTIVDCRCSPEWTALPYYDTIFPEPGISHPCPCVERKLAEVEKRTSTVPRNRMSNDYSKRSSLATGERTTSEKRASTISAISASSFKRLSSISSSQSAEVTRDTALQETMAALLRNETSNSATDTLALRNLQFERLVSGRENAEGERVPAYEG